MQGWQNAAQRDPKTDRQHPSTDAPQCRNLLQAPASTVILPAAPGGTRRAGEGTGVAMAGVVALGAFMGAGLVSAPAHAGPVSTISVLSDPDGWFEFTGTVNYPIGTTTDVDVYAVYRIAEMTVKGVTTVDYSKSTITFIQKTGVNGWNGFTTLPVMITAVTFVKGMSGAIASISFSSPTFDPQTPAGYTDKGLAGMIDVGKGTGEFKDMYTNDTKKTEITHTTTVDKITQTMFDTNALPPAVPRIGGNVQKKKIPMIPAPVPEPSTIALLGQSLALAAGATFGFGKRRRRANRAAAAPLEG
jgi:hypothetical protein